MTHSKLPLVACLVFAIIFLLAPGNLRAADYYQTLEIDGLKITIDVWSGAGTTGYIPVIIDIANHTADRTIEITGQSQGYFNYMGGYYGEPRFGGLDLLQTIRLKRGDRQRLTIPLPVVADNENVQLQIRERGRILHRAPFSFQTVGNPDLAPVLIVANPASAFGKAARDLGRTELPAGQAPEVGGFPPPGRPPSVSATGSFDMTREPERLPTSWLAFTTIRAIFIGKQEWKELSAAQKDALLAWSASGGDLSFVDGDVETLFSDTQRRPAAMGLGSASDRYFFGQVFFPSLAELREKGLQKTLNEMSAGPNSARAASPSDKVMTDSEATNLRIKPAQNATEKSTWRLPMPSIAGGDPRRGYLGGYDSAARNASGFKLPIPGVGGVSTRAYLAILVLFTLLIGPINYWFLKRRRQQVLMVLTTPLISVVFIVLLAGYAIAGEGFGIRARAETFTFLDQISKQAATRSTVSLYAAGMAPWSGLVFPKDAAIFADPLSYSQRALDLTETQQYTSGMLQARAPANFDEIAFRTARERLNFSREGSGIAVVNALGGTVQQLYYRDGGRIYTLAQTLAPGARAELQPGVHKPEALVTARSPERSDKFQHFFLDSLADGAFYAVLDRSPFLEPGVSNIEERSSFHEVAGYAGGEP